MAGLLRKRVDANLIISVFLEKNGSEIFRQAYALGLNSRPRVSGQGLLQPGRQTLRESRFHGKADHQGTVGQVVIALNGEIKISDAQVQSPE